MAKRRNRPIAPATVNRSVVEPLRKLFIRARVVWRYSFQREPLWRNHRLKEPTERVRELHASDSAALDGALRPDFELWFRFARGLRDADINSRIILFASISGSAPSLSRARIGSDAKLIRVNLLVDCDAPGLADDFFGRDPEQSTCAPDEVVLQGTLAAFFLVSPLFDRPRAVAAFVQGHSRLNAALPRRCCPFRHSSLVPPTCRKGNGQL
jgi:hypothetical protein